MTKYSKLIIFGLLVGLFAPSFVSASGFPILYSGKATLKQGNSSFYSTEGFDHDSLPTSRTKVLVAATNSSYSEDCDLLIPDHLIDCLEIGLDKDKNYYSFSARAHPNTQVYSGKLLVNGESVDSESVLVYAGKQANGDIYSKSANAFSGFTSYGDYLGINNPAVNTTWKIKGYQINPSSLLYWDSSNFLSNASMKKNVARLQGFSSSLNTATITNLAYPTISVNINSGTDPDLPKKNDSMNPEGKIIWVDGGLSIKAKTTISGHGTIIVNGDLDITGDLCIGTRATDGSCNFDDSSVGIVVLGNLTANSGGVLKLHSVIFCPGRVDIARSLFYSGAIVANYINITGNTAIVNFDKALYEEPPPGISYFMTPDINESF